MQRQNKLKLEPVKSYSVPEYPSKAEVIKNPEILRRIPEKWRMNPVLCAVLAFTLSSGLYACTKTSGQENNETDVSVLISDNESGVFVPIFDHGEGRGSYGCVSVAPPVFLSEEEAIQVIREEAMLQGVDFSSSETITEAVLPITNEFGDDKFADKTKQGALELDGYDTKLGIGFEYVSKEDFDSLKETGNMMSSVSTFDMKDAAKRLADNNKNTAFFYDPTSEWKEFDFDHEQSEISWEDYLEKYEAEQIEKMKEKLREQVRDFLSWLKGEEII